MKTYIYIIIVAYTSLFALNSCGTDNFTIESKIENMGTQNIRVLYIADDNVNATWLPAINGEFQYQGLSSEYTIVNILTQRAETITQAIARNGDILEITGDFKNRNSIKVSGNKINDSYFSFINKHQDLFKSGDKEKIDTEIIKFIKNNPDNIASTMLLYSKFSDINNKQLIDSLLTLIDIKARPDNITEYYLTDISRVINSDTIASTISPFYMSSTKDKVYEFDPTNAGKGLSIIYFWGDDTIGQSRRVNTINSMLNWHKDKQIQVTDISLMQDKLKWERVVNRDSVPWIHLQAIGAEFNKVIKELEITQTPLYIVTDTLGGVLYRGSELNRVSSILDVYITEKED